jgi:arylsulfatase A-like enzyme
MAVLLILLTTALLLYATGPAKPGKPAPESPKAPTSGKPCLLFITIDTWRWDHIGVSGQGKAQTPALDRLARGGVYESEMLTPYPLTTPSHATMLTGLNPLRHRVLDCMSYTLPANIPTLAEAFKAAGYKTGAIVSGDTLKRRFGLTRGFDLYDDGGMQKRYADDPMPSSRDGLLTTKAAQEFLRGLKPGEPAFLWVHYFDLHTPYRPRRAYEAKNPKSRYAAQVAFVDDQIAALVAAAGADRGRSWRIVVVGDHGEAFGEHHEIGHGYGLYRPTLSVPFIVSPKPAAPIAHAKPWGLIDLEPTLREWFALPANPKVDGESLFRVGNPNRSLTSISLLASFMFNVNPIYGIRKGASMYVKHASEELYDVSKDPDEARDLAAGPTRKKELEAMRELCGAAFSQKEIQSILNPTLQSSKAELDSLQGLGYIQGATPKLNEAQRVDLGTVLDDYNALQKARNSLNKTGDTKKLKETYDAFVKKYPRAASIYRAYGRLMLQTKDYDAAFGAFDRAVRLNPNDPDSLLNLGTLYLQLNKNPKAAVALLERSLQLSEAEPIAHLNLGIIYNDIHKDSKKAYPHFKRFVELDPENEEAPNIRAVIKKMEAGGIK